MGRCGCDAGPVRQPDPGSGLAGLERAHRRSGAHGGTHDRGWPRGRRARHRAWAGSDRSGRSGRGPPAGRHDQHARPDAGRDRGAGPLRGDSVPDRDPGSARGRTGGRPAVLRGRLPAAPASDAHRPRDRPGDGHPGGLRPWRLVGDRRRDRGRAGHPRAGLARAPGIDEPGRSVGRQPGRPGGRPDRPAAGGPRHRRTADDDARPRRDLPDDRHRGEPGPRDRRDDDPDPRRRPGLGRRLGRHPGRRRRSASDPALGRGLVRRARTRPEAGRRRRLGQGPRGPGG